MNIKEIPGTLGFKVSEDGVVYDPGGTERNTYVNGDGYITASVKLTNGNWRTFGVHRLLALAHIECPGDPDELEVARTRGSREVVAYNRDEKKLSFHSNGVDFYRTYGLSKKAVTTALRIGRLRNVGGWVFIYYTPTNLKKLMEFVGSPVP